VRSLRRTETVFWCVWRFHSRRLCRICVAPFDVITTYDIIYVPLIKVGLICYIMINIKLYFFYDWTVTHALCFVTCTLAVSLISECRRNRCVLITGVPMIRTSKQHVMKELFDGQIWAQYYSNIWYTIFMYFFEQSFYSNVCIITTTTTFWKATLLASTPPQSI